MVAEREDRLVSSIEDPDKLNNTSSEKWTVCEPPLFDPYSS
jgi:hypothetical protein